MVREEAGHALIISHGYFCLRTVVIWVERMPGDFNPIKIKMKYQSKEKIREKVKSALTKIPFFELRNILWQQIFKKCHVLMMG